MTNKRGFTLIELLVVVGIIAILSTLIVVYFNTAKMSARDARRLSDVKQIQLALKMYYTDVGIYPTAITAGNSIANGGTNYLLRIPANPTPRADNGCPDQEYQYKQLENGARYSLSFCLGDRTDDIDAGLRVATANGILNCPSGWVAVPGSSTFNTNDFCVMEYEAKCVDANTPTTGKTSPNTGSTATYDNSTTACTGGSPNKFVASVSSGYPIGNINRATASTYCNNIGGHLMTNAEWMTIARNIESVASNWSGASVGSGYVNIGNHAVTAAMDGTATHGSGGATHYYKRAHILSSTDTINDIAGNVTELLDTTCTSGSGAGNYDSSSGSYVEWNLTSSPDLSDYEKGAAGPLGAYTSTHAIGKYKGCTTTGYLFIRGGAANTAVANAGIYEVDLNNATSASGALIGFRCVK